MPKAKAKKTTRNSKKKPIEQYAHKGKQRANNPPVGLVNPHTEKESGERKRIAVKIVDDRAIESLKLLDLH